MEIDLTTIAGIAFAAWFLTNLLLCFWAGRKPEEQQAAAIVIALLLALAAKLGGVGFADVNWLGFLIQVAIATAGGTIGAGQTHDKIGKPLAKLLGIAKTNPP